MQRVWTSKPGQKKNARELAHEAVFGLLHFAAGSGGLVVMAAQVEKAMNDVADEFGLPGDAKTPGLQQRFIHTDENFTAQRRGFVGGAQRAGPARYARRGFCF
jgi:hypothetical protein